MENVLQMAIKSERNRCVVQRGLDRRAQERERAQMDATMDAYEQDMIRGCNDHRDSARIMGQSAQVIRYVRKGCRTRISARASAKAANEQYKRVAFLGWIGFLISAVMFSSLMVYGFLPVLVACSCIGSGAGFLVAYTIIVRDAFAKVGAKNERKSASQHSASAV